ncbi:hypothetical protein IAD21_05254 [Abditibacteriota bacterium]|nr:hypothetical protein IAD21_05254 [Abditibacteriota bacterium]
MKYSPAQVEVIEHFRRRMLFMAMGLCLLLFIGTVWLVFTGQSPVTALLVPIAALSGGIGSLVGRRNLLVYRALLCVSGISSLLSLVFLIKHG